MRDFFELETITIKINYEPRKVCVMDYVNATLKDLREFGYMGLTERHVLNSVWRVVSKEKLEDVIDYFIKDDIILD